MLKYFAAIFCRPFRRCRPYRHLPTMFMPQSSPWRTSQEREIKMQCNDNGSYRMCFKEMIKLCTVNKMRHGSTTWWMAAHAQIFRNVCSFRSLFEICDIVCYSEVIRLESAEVGKKSPNCGAKFADFRPSKCRAYRDLRCTITPHSDFMAKVPRSDVLRPRRLNKKASIRWQDSAPPISGYWPTSEPNAG